MDDRRRDDVDTWLHARIDPLPPPPGTFELIKRRARRRKMRQVLVTATAAAAVVAAVIVVPRMVTLNVTPNQGSAAANGSAASPSGHGAVSGSAVPNVSSTAGSSAQIPETAPVPADFAATSVTFVGLGTGWVIGQAGVPGTACATQYCTSLARTDNAGKTWSGVHAPVTGPPSGSSGVSQVRFLNTSFGWAFGPALWATQDGGQTWTQVQTGGQRVTDLETVGDRAFAVFATCAGSGSDFAAQCTSFSLYSATAGSNNWAPVSGPVTGLSNNGLAASASLVLTSSRGYLLSPDGTLYAGPVDGSGPWQQTSIAATGRNPCGGLRAAQADGQPATAMLAAASSSSLVLACTAGAGTGIYTSADGGQTWQQQATAPGSADTTSLAAQPGGEIIVATTDGIAVSHNGGDSWQESALPPSGPSGGFSYVGMTSPEQGVAVPANTSEHAIWFTFDGGLSWQASPIKG